MIKQEAEHRSDYLYRAILGSLLVHMVLAFLLLRSYQDVPSQVQIFEASIEAPPPRQPKAAPEVKRQIVTPPAALSSAPLEETPLMSDRDSSAQRQQLHRGDAPEAAAQRGVDQAPAPQVRVASQKPAQPSTEASRPQPRPQSKSPPAPNLLLDQRTVLEKFGDLNSTSEHKKASKAHSTKLDDLSGYQAFSRPYGSGAAILGTQGSSDYLPYLPDGDITMLNAKAEHFAVFVRRVALQVFSNMRQSGWEFLSYGDVKAVQDFTTVRAILSPQGKLLRVVAETSSGSQRFDMVLRDAVQRGAQDSNPPPEARAADGTIQFIFQSRSWSEPAVNSHGVPQERRWLLLATGLE